MTLISHIVIILLSTSLHTLTFSKYTNKSFNFSFLYPDSWQRKVINMDYKHIVLLKKGYNITVKITARKVDPTVREKWQRWKTWYFTGYGRWYRKIIETKTISIKNKAKGKLHVFAYTQRGIRILQRLLVFEHKKNMIIIECKAPLSVFYRYSPVFDTVMGSFTVIK